MIQPKLTCPYGHPLIGMNILINKHGHRRCRLCKQAYYQKWYNKSGKKWMIDWRKNYKADVG